MAYWHSLLWGWQLPTSQAGTKYNGLSEFPANNCLIVCPANKDPLFHMLWKWIHEFNWLNSCEFTRFCERIWCVDTCLSIRVFHVTTRTSETGSVLTQYDLCQTRSKLVTTGRTRVFTWMHILVEQYQLWASMTRANWFRNGSLFAGCMTSH